MTSRMPRSGDFLGDFVGMLRPPNEQTAVETTVALPAWDSARAGNTTVQLDPPLVELANQHEQIARRYAGLFAGSGLGLSLSLTVLHFIATTAKILWLVDALGLLFVAGLLALPAMIIGWILSVRALNEQKTQVVSDYETRRAAINARVRNETQRTQAEIATMFGVQGKAWNRPLMIYQNGKPLLTAPPERREWQPTLGDLLYFVEMTWAWQSKNEKGEIIKAGHTKELWLGKSLPSGILLSEFDDYAKVIKPFEILGLLVDRAERQAGRWVIEDKERVKQIVEAAFDPGGTFHAVEAHST